MEESYKIPECYIDFRIRNVERFQVFARFFTALKTWLHRPKPAIVEAGADDSTHHTRSYDKAEDWMLNFRPQDLELLGMPDHKASIVALKAWRDLSRKERRTRINKDPALQMLADFSDMLKYFRDVDFDLVSCEQIERDYARIRIQPYTTIVENRAALEELLLFFGFYSIIQENC